MLGNNNEYTRGTRVFGYTPQFNYSIVDAKETHVTPSGLSAAACMQSRREREVPEFTEMRIKLGSATRRRAHVEKIFSEG